MIKSVLVRSRCSPLLVEAKDFHCSSSSKRVVSRITCGSSSSSSSSSGSRSSDYIPKLEPFSRTKLERVIKEPPLIEKYEIELADYCSTLEGDDSYSCWRAYFELKELERESPKEDVERLILQIGGVKSLIGCLHGISSMHKEEKSNTLSFTKPLNVERERERERDHAQYQMDCQSRERSLRRKREPGCQIPHILGCLELKESFLLGTLPFRTMKQIDKSDGQCFGRFGALCSR